LRDAAFSGLQLAASAGEGRSLLMVFSDGVDRSSWLRDADLVAAARETETTAYAVTVGHQASPVLRDIAGATGGEMFEATANQNLRAAFLRVMDDFGSRYLLGYTPRGPTRPGWHSITVRVRGRDYTVKARPGYVRARDR
jgi:VWFA-related protein